MKQNEYINTYFFLHKKGPQKTTKNTPTTTCCPIVDVSE